MKAKKRILAVILALCLVVPMLPLSALATGAFQITSSSPTFVAGNTSTAARQSVTVDAASIGSSIGNSIGNSLGASGNPGVSLTWNITGTNASKFVLYADNSTTTPLSGTTSNTTIYVGVATGQTLAQGDIASVTVSDGTSSDSIAITINAAPPVDATVTGTTYLYDSNGKNVLGGAWVYLYNSNYSYIGSAITASNGTYSITVPVAMQTDTYRIDASSNFILGRLRLNKDENGLESGSRTITAAEAKAGVDFGFVDPPKVRGTIVDSVTNARIEGANVNVWDSVESSADGTFLAQSRISSTGQQSVYVSAYKSGYYYGGKSVSENVKIADLKAGTPINAGEIALEKINTAGTWGNAAKNNLMLVPNTVTSNEISNATVNLYADQSAAVTDAQVKITADSGAVIKVADASYVRVTAGGVKVQPKSVTVSPDASEMIITLDIQPRTQYQITFGVQAPADPDESSYMLKAYVGSQLIGQQTAIIHNLTVNAPSEIGARDTFTIYGEVTSDSDIKVKLKITSPVGEEVYSNTTNGVGLFYKFSSISFPSGKNLPYGEYTVSVEAYSQKGNKNIATATTTMLIVDSPVSINMMSLSDDFNTVSSVTNPTPGSFLTFVGWVGGDLWSFDWRNLTANVALNNAQNVQSAKFVMNTTHGKFEWNAAKSGSNFSARLERYQGTGKASVSIEITKTDGSKITYTIGNIIILIDPSGYVYDNVTNEPIQGATATLYYKTEAGEWEIWPAEDYMQVNPQLTDSEGAYGWMVSEGEYEVRVTADGYEDYSTLGDYDIISVLPERKDINIGLTPLTATVTDIVNKALTCEQGSTNISMPAYSQLLIPVDASYFTWSIAPGQLTPTLMTSNGVGLGYSITKGASAIGRIQFVSKDGNLYISVPLTGTSITTSFEVTVWLTLNRIKYAGTEITITGTIDAFNDDSSDSGASNYGSSGSRSGSGTLTPASTSAVPQALSSDAAVSLVNAALSAAKQAGSSTAVVTTRNTSSLPLATIQAMIKAANGTPILFNADTLSQDEKSVEVRISFNPAKATKDLNLSASTTSTHAQSIKTLFSKWFSNDISVISLSQKESFGLPVEIAAKVDPKLGTKSFYVYAYNAVTNTYTQVAAPNCWVDANGYLHFTTTMAGDIVICNKPLQIK